MTAKALLASIIRPDLKPADDELGTLSPEEAAMLPIPRDQYEQSETDWLYFALHLARGARIRAGRMDQDSPDYYAERFAQGIALDVARSHAANLTKRGYALSADLAAFMKREGI